MSGGMPGRVGPPQLHYLPPGGGLADGGEIDGYTPVKFARGGGAKGNTDTVPAMLTPGEFVVRRASAQAHKGLLQKINRSDGGPIKGYAKGGTVAPEKRGQRPIHFKKGALHRELGVPESEKIPAKKMAAARSGSLGPLAKKRANFAKNVLTGGR
jgi:hypothetical protein